MKSTTYSDIDQLFAGSDLDDNGFSSVDYDESSEGELDQADFEHELEDAEAGL